MLRFFAPEMTRSGFLSLFTSPMSTLPAPPATEIGESDACLNNDCCASLLLAFPDRHAVKSRHKTIGSIERMVMEYFKTISFATWSADRGLQRLDVQRVIFFHLLMLSN